MCGLCRGTGDGFGFEAEFSSLLPLLLQQTQVSAPSDARCGRKGEGLPATLGAAAVSDTGLATEGSQSGGRFPRPTQDRGGAKPDESRDVHAFASVALAVERTRTVNGGSLRGGLSTAVPEAVRLGTPCEPPGRRAAVKATQWTLAAGGMKFCNCSMPRAVPGRQRFGASVSGGSSVNCGLCVALGQTGAAVFHRQTALIKLRSRRTRGLLSVAWSEPEDSEGLA